MNAAPSSWLLEVPLPAPLDAELAGEVQKQSVYLSEDIVRFGFSADRAMLQLQLKPGSRAEDVAAKAMRFVASMARGHRRIEPVVHYQRQRREPSSYTTGVYDGLRQRGWLYEHSPGVVSLSGPALALHELVDATFARAWQQAFGAQHRPFPAMVDARLLARCGYFEMHPNAVSFVARLRNDFDEIEAFRVANRDRRDGLYLTEARAFAPPAHCLNPAACFPCYEALQGQTLAAEGLALTWAGRVFRYESANMAGLDRLWEFNVRELVLLGDGAFIRARRQQAIDLVLEQVERWELDARLETATDPFFATVHAARAFWQKSMDVKQEVRLALTPDAEGAPRSVAAGSVNLHGAFFGERFAILDALGQPAQTACVGLGLERWVLALFTQHGFDFSRWPQGLREPFGA